MLPPIANILAETRARVAVARKAGRRVGFVPTMGALHAGHAALIRAARTGSDYAVVSIFVNPTQFGPTEDFSRYPRTLEADRELCAEVGTDLIFAPTPEEMHPADSRTLVEVTGVQDVLCGASRPGHFRGVATVVLKLLNIVQPDIAYFGQKDAQQTVVIRRMVEDLNVPVTIHIHPTVREPDGLAMSSRNRYLDPTQRMHATSLHRALKKVEESFGRGERRASELENAMSAILTATPGARLDYARVVDAETLDGVSHIDRPALAAVAVFFGNTRLIDNTLLAP